MRRRRRNAAGGSAETRTAGRAGAPRPIRSERLKNAAPLRLHVPEPPARPGETPDFGWLNIPEAGSVPRPDIATAPSEMRGHAYT
ncbi:MAG: hypothetical protein ACREFT_15620, partial [Acetobacteraceae bacterium]